MQPARDPVSTENPREGELTAARIAELTLSPVRGTFDTAHLRETHRRIFQDLPEHAPGEFRPDAEGHYKTRTLAKSGVRYDVAYPRAEEVPERLQQALEGRDLVAELRGQSKEGFASRMAKLYAELDYAHPFREGNSRTLRAFTRQLAEEAGHRLSWSVLLDSPHARELLYLARDREVFTRAYPGIGKPGFEPKDRLQHEADNVVKHAGTAYPTLERVMATAHQERPPPERGPTAAPPVPERDIER